MKNKPQLFCFTYAGGSAKFFNVIEKDLMDIDVVKLEYAGHGERYKEDFYEDFAELANDMFCKLKDKCIGKYALFGYSMGSISLIEVLKKIIDAKMLLPSCIFIAAHEPHTKSELSGFTADEIDEWVKIRTINFGGVPEKLFHNNAFWRIYLPIYRADYAIIGKYEFKELDLKTKIPASVFYSETDTPLKEIELWKNYFIGNIHLYQFDGGHFFIQQHHLEMAQIIKKKMEKLNDI